jgi:FkbM family methyltransferase
LVTTVNMYIALQIHYLSTLTRIVSRWGWIEGLKFYDKVQRIKPEQWHLPELKHAVHLRQGTSDHNVFKQIFGKGDYDLKLPFVPKTIMDGGANIGLFAVLMANRYPDAAIVSIEPDEDNYRQLCKNTAPYKGVTAIQAGIWNSNCHLQIVDKTSDAWSLQVEEAPAGTTTNLPAMHILQLMQNAGWQQIDLLKLDVEGAEAMICKDNYEGWLAQTRMLIIELHEKSLSGSSHSFEKAILNRYATRFTYGEFEVFY